MNQLKDAQTQKTPEFNRKAVKYIFLYCKYLKLKYIIIKLL